MNKKTFIFVLLFLVASSFLVLSCSTASKRSLCAIAPCLPVQKGISATRVSTGPVKIPSSLDIQKKKRDMFTDYVIGPEDIIEVSVWKNAALSKIVTVRPDGKISLPLIGDIRAAGITASELKKVIADRLLEYKETPEVSVILQQVNSYMFYIMGEVLKPGKYPMKSQATLLQAITMAGGFTQFASKNKILLLRRNGSEEIRIKFRYDDIITGKKGTMDPILLPGDRVVVP